MSTVHVVGLGFLTPHVAEVRLAATGHLAGMTLMSTGHLMVAWLVLTVHLAGLVEAGVAVVSVVFAFYVAEPGVVSFFFVNFCSRHHVL